MINDGDTVSLPNYYTHRIVIDGSHEDVSLVLSGPCFHFTLGLWVDKTLDLNNRMTDMIGVDQPHATHAEDNTGRYWLQYATVLAM